MTTDFYTPVQTTIDASFEALRSSCFGVCCLDQDGQILKVNAAFSSMLECHSEQLLSRTIFEFSDPQERSLIQQRIRELFGHQKNGYELQRTFISQNHQAIRTQLSATSIRDAQHNTVAILMVVIDISASLQREHELKILSSAVENSGSAVCITDARGRIEYVNPRFCDMTGYSIDEVLGQTPRILKSDRTSQNTYQELWSTVLNHQKWRGSLYNRRKNGSHYWALQSISPVHDEQGNLVNIVSVSEDISQLKEHEQQMEKLAFFDPLTNLGNRRNFRQQLERVLDTPSEGYNALLLLDLDHFKQINDTLGHEAGDVLLKTIANRLRFCLPDSNAVFRLGGDEFTVIIEGVSAPAMLHRHASELISLLSQPLQLGPHEMLVTVSIGITLIGLDANDVSGLLRNADLAMYQAKRKGRNTYKFFAPEMNLEAKKALTMDHDLRQALENNGFELHYQPQICLRTGRLITIEALLRWPHPIQGSISPVEFIPKAEETGLIVPIGAWVLREACRSVAHLHKNGLEGLRVAVNISARQFEDSSLLSTIEQALLASGLPAHCLELEITEGVLMSNPDHCVEILRRIKRLGVSLSLDDFGTGYSSLAYLKKMPVDLLKIDRSFVQDLPADSDDIAITSTIIAMASQLGLEVVAEGIETRAQLEFLTQQGCEYGQGYLLSQPMPLEALQDTYKDCQTDCRLCDHVQSCASAIRNRRRKLGISD